ncbi:Uncharacterized conserved protein YjbJ, UPF0337 family [Tranquillimonas rosea]|uniref:Uncharacterized conserved protein YjbJ, UPF0337 family n=1 Tax=Tranquillimonas rosea TaxID=641238 RepID=A0A1H9S9S8_9RHOB|nr:CsbD family protein [Tranquillimonas rosea]SER81133.1 Uncharacterized conserved protein YjbJ, UPF0337 family [Tranquillimonas rosea]
MDWDQVKGNWKQMKGRVQARWGQLTDDEVEEAAGNRERLEGLIQERYGETKEQVRADVDSWLADEDANDQTHRA